MKKGKTKIIGLISLGAMLASMLFVCISTAIPAFATLLNVSEGTYFPYTYEGHVFKCYHFEDGEPGVAIAWGETTENVPSHINVPSSVTHGDDTYDVRAVARHGFRFCGFETIDLPNSIEQIQEEAFAYCTNLKTISIPYLVDKIYPSTFLDCRSLESVHYLNALGQPAFGNNTITEIGDHAFDSCVSLRDFNCPRKVTYFGESSFKNCRELVNFYFPSTIWDGDDITNYVTVRSYAFADCSSLVFVYFETNMGEVDDYAFVDCHSNLKIRYNGDSNPSYAREGVNQAHWRDTNIASNIPDLIPIVLHPTIHSDDNYPCIKYTLKSDVVMLDAAQTNATEITIISAAEIAAEGEYAVIYKFDTPSEDIAGCYDVDDGILTIPDTLNGKTVKIIESNAFANNLDIKEVHFNANLVQIKNHAFFNSTEIGVLDFSSCTKLKEVSYQVFNEGSEAYPNRALTELHLPNCLEFIGGYAFSCLYSVNALTLPNSLRAFDDLAFYRLGFEVSAADANIHLLLPKSLNDADAAKAKFKHLSKGKYDHSNRAPYYAVGKYSFNEAKSIVSVTMEDDPAHADDNSYTCSFYSNAFHTASNLVRFKTSKNLAFLGKDIFKNCSGLREVFLCTAKSEATGHANPWCINEENGSYGGTLFFGSLPECVCYIDGEHAPGNLENYTLTSENSEAQLNSMWNAETESSYPNQAAPNTLSRRLVPTYRGVDFENDIKYWKPDTNTFLSTPPMTLDDYKSGFLTFVKELDNKWTTAKYYCDPDLMTGYDYIDLTNVPGISDGTTNDLTRIGDCSFSRGWNFGLENAERKRQPGLYFVLPTTITSIGNRAFYRNTNPNETTSKANGRYGARIITYKVGSNYISDDGTTQLNYTNFRKKITDLEKQVDANKRGYCVLPPNVTSIGNLAFYNNIFQRVTLPSGLNYLGAGAFYANSTGSAPRSVTTTISFSGANANFTISNGGIYYTGSGNAKKMLISTANGNATTFTLAADTKAIGFEACAGTKYTTVNLTNSVTTIYGTAFADNMSLKTVNNTSGIRYISAMENPSGISTTWNDPDYEEVWDQSHAMATHFSNTDYRDYAYEPREEIDSLYGAFNNCIALETINFKAMTELRRIGPYAFNGCKSLKTMAGNTSYVYKTYNATTKTTTAVSDGRSANNTNVLDLSGCSHLRSISFNAFFGCNTLKYIHLPDNRNGASESTLYIGFDPEAPTFGNSRGQIINDGKGTSILVGESALYAHHDFGKSNNADKHYPALCFYKNAGNPANTIYYHVGSAADIPTDDDQSIKYWTKSGSDYILISSARDARVYFGVE